MMFAAALRADCLPSIVLCRSASNMKWTKTGGGSISSDGKTWTQGTSSHYAWTGAIADVGMCTDGRGKYEWKIHIVKGTYHQAGIALANWDGRGTDKSGSNEKFAFLYSHSSGWNRHRGTATRDPSFHGWWSGTWDRQSKGKELTVTLDCSARTFEVKTEKQKLGRMKYPSSWTTVYPAVGGQSNDHVLKLGSGDAPCSSCQPHKRAGTNCAYK